MTQASTNEACPSDFALDDRAVHGGTTAATIDTHVATCPRCQARLRVRALHVSRFDAALAGPVWQGVQARRAAGDARIGAGAARGPRLFSWPVLALALGGAAAIPLLVMVLPRHATRAVGSAAYIATKGRAAVDIVCRRAGRVFALAPDQPVAPGDELRFLARPVAAPPTARPLAFIQIGSVDGGGAYAPFYPSQDGSASVPLPAPGTALPGSIRLDDAPGPERLFVVLSARPLSVAAVAAAARAHAKARTPVTEIDGATAVTDWIVLDKRATAGEGH